MQRVLLIIGLAVNMLALFLMCLGLVLRQQILLIVGLFVLMLNIFLSVLALVIRPEENFSQFRERVIDGTPLARVAVPRASIPPRVRA
ncbi:TPA_asm: ORFX protein [Ligusticum chuanxiong waikavirus]|uniref:ORFX protein n=1 Tax=Ligusticum chuanxiong waikavirus TaxID=3027343 RepID=A0AA48P941_9SECO|nr:TPA_asm: ORFX protein [Ligusticum chuanxiong waikavirus]